MRCASSGDDVVTAVDVGGGGSNDVGKLSVTIGGMNRLTLCHTEVNNERDLDGVA